MYIINKLEVGRKLYTIVDEPLNKLFLEEFFFEISVDSPPHLQNHGFQICHGVGVGWGGVLVFDVGWIKIQFQMCHVGCPWMMSNYLSMDDGSWMSNLNVQLFVHGCPWMSDVEKIPVLGGCLPPEFFNFFMDVPGNLSLQGSPTRRDSCIYTI